MRPDRSEKDALIVVAGPTASGKSALALAIAEACNGEIVNADSMQVYKELRVLTARPSLAEEARVPHHLYGVMSVNEVCSAGAWLRMAEDAIAAIRARGRFAIVCGGTGLYLKVLAEGIAEVPEVPKAVVDEGRHLYDTEGGEVFRTRLAALDADAAARLTSGDRQRLMRAWAVVTATGKTLAQWQAGQPGTSPVPGRRLTLALTPPRDLLYARIEARLDAMITAGALDEVAALADLDPGPDQPAMKALGVPDFRSHLEGHCDLAEALIKAKQATRNFAKRQLTWFRNQMAADLVIEDFGDRALDQGISAVQEFLSVSQGGTC
jgi:tRNA dimethylallyltransferase